MTVQSTMIQEYTLAVVGNMTATAMTRTGPNGDTIGHGGAGILAGVLVDLGTATTLDVVIKDSTGYILFSATSVTADTSTGPENTSFSARPAQGAITATLTNVSNSSTGTATIRARIKK